ncbi:methyl-accepting chemotaxis sensory transducer with GAF sensor [Geothermobacter ehrlichii]|uniref:Methyl-accepting chemotaxis sensory transducer with GAF sensor n=2 Tax=Geothermobacter ehrlichii TaxID=213224 RepID=A0A5D3WNM4_9BACT|nr:methyl-accepting chemotaxis sensory transducer with GAF sensor [Geothermobacter ehrlichii]
MGKAWLCCLAGFFLGFLAPVGWLVLRLVFFRQAGQSLFEQIVGEVAGSSPQVALYVYMGLGTALVFALFGYLIGRAWQQLHERAKRLDSLNATMEAQRDEFEERFNALNSNIKNFHAINTLIQKSGSVNEVIRLAADGLYNILGYDRVNIWMLDADRKNLVLAISKGTGYEGELSLPLDERLGVIYKAVLEGRPFRVDDMRKMPADYRLAEEYTGHEPIRSRSFILCPIRVHDRVVGLFGVDNKRKKAQLDDTDVDTVRLFADQVAMTLTKIDLLRAVDSLTRELERTFGELLGYREDYVAINRQLKEAGQGNADTIREISGSAEVVREAVEETRSAAGEISVTIAQVSENINSLHEFIDSSVASITEMAATLKSVEENAVQSQTMIEGVQERAQDGVRRVEETIAAMERIRQAVETATADIARLSGISDEVGGITMVIGEIAKKTNLLALNAAIIAAQAGEHGSSFAVVADEVGALAREAGESTEAIARLVGEIRAATGDVVRNIETTRDMVDKGISTGVELEGSLQQMVEQADNSTGMSREIRKATNEVAKSAEAINTSVIRLGEMAAQISHASKEQTRGIRSIVHAIEEIKTMTDDMVAATERQQVNMRNIDTAVDRVGRMASRIFRELDSRQQGSQEVIEKLEVVRALGRKKDD